MRKSVNSELKVKHPYSYLIKVILLGIVMLFSGIFSAVMINEISHDHHIDNGIYAADDEFTMTMTWDGTKRTKA